MFRVQVRRLVRVFNHGFVTRVSTGCDKASQGFIKLLYRVL